MSSQRSVTHGTFVIERSFPDSPARVFQAFADPALKRRWFGGAEMTTTQHDLDFRVGGEEISRGGPPDGPVFTYAATYQDIVPEQRIVTTYVMDMGERRISASVTTIEFAPQGNNATHMVFTEQGVFLDGLDTPAQREEGSREFLDNLARFLETRDDSR
ncbi:MAG: SRPBCC family protein [Chloroflexi bacterium]|nr:SRPBCC family protein [Chloroflexota bacterium]